MPSAPEVAITPAPKRLGKPCATIAGMRTEPIATTVAGEEPDTAANSAQATTPARPRPPYQCPTMVVAKWIIRRATPPCVRKVPARIKNGIAMISKLSSPVNSLSATDSVGTSVSANIKLSTVRPSAIDTGMPVNISEMSSANSTKARMPCGSTRNPALCAKQMATIRSGTRMMINPSGVESGLLAFGRHRLGMKIVLFDALDVAGVVMRQFAGPKEPPRDLQEPEAHQSGTERDRRKDDPHSHFKVVRSNPGMVDFPDEGAAKDSDCRREQSAAQQAEHDHALARGRPQHVDEHVDADMDAGAHAIGGAELGHPDEHVDAQLLRPGNVQRAEPAKYGKQDRREQRQAVRGCPFRQIDRGAGAVAMDHRDENQKRRGRDQRRDQPLFQDGRARVKTHANPPGAKSSGRKRVAPGRFYCSESIRPVTF